MSRGSKRQARASKGQPRSRRDRVAAPSVFWRELALVLACLEIAVLILVFDPALRNVFDLPKATFSHMLAWALLGVLVVIALADGLRIPGSPLFLAFYAVLAGEVLTTITATNQYVALFGEVGRYLGLTTHAAFALVAIAIAATLGYPQRAAWLAWAVGGLAAVTAVYAVQQALGADPIRWTDVDSKARPFSTLGNPNFYGQFLAVVLVSSVAVLTFARRARAWVTGVAALGALVTAGLMVIVATRGALLGVAAGLLVLGGLWLRREGLTRLALLRIGGGAAAGVVLFLLLIPTTPLGARLADLTQGEGEGGLRSRLLIYQAAAGMFVDHPLVGVGFENFAVVYPRYQQAEWFTLAGTNTTNTSAHSFFLHLAATTGLVGLAGTVVLLALFAVHTWRRVRDTDSGPLVVAAAALAAFHGSGIVLPGAQSIQWIPWACIGVALASELRGARSLPVFQPLALPMAVRILIVAGLASVAFTQLGSLTANRSAKTAELALGQPADAARAAGAARAATTMDPGRAVYWNDLGRALELVPDLSAARAAYREATSRAPYSPAFWWNLGRMEQEHAKRGEAGAAEAAIGAMQRAIAAGPENPESFDRLARVQFNLGDYAGAIASERQAIGFFATDPRYYTLAAEAARQLHDTAASIDFLRQGVGSTDSNDLRVALARALIAAGRISDARAVLGDALTKEPANAAALDLLKQIEGR